MDNVDLTTEPPPTMMIKTSEVFDHNSIDTDSSSSVWKTEAEVGFVSDCFNCCNFFLFLDSQRHVDCGGKDADDRRYFGMR